MELSGRQKRPGASCEKIPIPESYVLLQNGQTLHYDKFVQVMRKKKETSEFRDHSYFMLVGNERKRKKGASLGNTPILEILGMTENRKLYERALRIA